MEVKLEEVKSIFEKANKTFIKNSDELFKNRVSERTLCGALMIEIHKVLHEKEYSKYSNYNVDVEYNRTSNGKLKTTIKTIKGPEDKMIRINCDLIVHRRGESGSGANLIAIEMKKNYRVNKEKDSDRDRLVCLTKSPYDVISGDGKTNPKFVCGYVLGVYYEINYLEKKVKVEYYYNGYEKPIESYELNLY